jgi:hypothetical protein
VTLNLGAVGSTPTGLANEISNLDNASPSQMPAGLTSWVTDGSGDRGRFGRWFGHREDDGILDGRVSAREGTSDVRAADGGRRKAVDRASGARVGISGVNWGFNRSGRAYGTRSQGAEESAASVVALSRTARSRDASEAIGQHTAGATQRSLGAVIWPVSCKRAFLL